MNISLQRIYAICMRLFKSSFHIARLFDDIYWPLMDILLIGMTGVWMESAQTDAQPYVLAMVVGAVLWQFITRPHLAISLSIFEELWARNFVNLFATPLNLTEWIIAAILLSIAKALFVFCLSGFFIWIIYAQNICSLGLIFFPFFFLMLLAGLTIGFFSAAALFVFGQKAQALVWAMCWLFAPFCGVYYPIHVLPKWMQMVGYTLPATYVLESMRSLVFTGHFSRKMLATGLILNIVYLTLAIACFVYTFERSRNKGLARLE